MCCDDEGRRRGLDRGHHVVVPVDGVHLDHPEVVRRVAIEARHLVRGRVSGDGRHLRPRRLVDALLDAVVHGGYVVVVFHRVGPHQVDRGIGGCERSGLTCELITEDRGHMTCLIPGSSRSSSKKSLFGGRVHSTVVAESPRGVGAGNTAAETRGLHSTMVYTRGKLGAPLRRC